MKDKIKGFNPKLKILVLATIVTMASLPLSIYAASDSYFGIGAVQSKWSDSAVINDTAVTFKYKKTNWKALIGKRLNSNWSIEGQYIDFATDGIIVNGIATKLDASGSSIGVAGLYYLNSQANYSPFVKLGIHSWDAEVDVLGLLSIRDDGTDEFYGVGMDGKISETMKYRIEFERMKSDNNDMDNIGVGLLFDF